MNTLITGTSQGIGKALAELFLVGGHAVIGIDRQCASISHKKLYTLSAGYPRLRASAGSSPRFRFSSITPETQNENDIDTNLKALIHITEKYGVQPQIHSILHIGSASAHTGSEFPEYCASKGGVLAYTKNVAMRVAPFGATCNSLDPGGVLTPLNDCVMQDADLWAQIMEEDAAAPLGHAGRNRTVGLFPDRHQYILHGPEHHRGWRRIHQT